MVVVGGLESKVSDQLWPSFSLTLAKPNNDWHGLSPSVLGGGVTGSHQLLPGLVLGNSYPKLQNPRTLKSQHRTSQLGGVQVQLWVQSRSLFLTLLGLL